MALYRKKSLDVEAVRFDPKGTHRLALPPGVAEYKPCGGDHSSERATFFVITILGFRTPIRAGEWVVTEPDGAHHYPYDHDVFVSRYDLIEENS